MRIHLLLLCLIGCFSTGVFAANPALIYQGDATATKQIIQDAAKAWKKQGNGTIQVHTFSTVSDIEAVSSGQADIAGSSRGKAPTRSNEKNLLFTPIAWDALVAIVNPRNKVSNLSLKQLHDIFYGKITNWQQVGGADRPIHAYAVASPTDGIEYSYRRLLFGRGNQPVAAPRLYLDVQQLQQAIALDPQSIGISTWSNVHANSKIKALSINHVHPAPATITKGQYLLYTPIYVVTRKESKPTPSSKTAQAFIDYLHGSQVGAIIRQHKMVPYQAASDLIGQDQTRLAKIEHFIKNPETVLPAPAAPASEPTQYKVVSGDTLYAIAKHHAVTIQQLRTWNHLASDQLSVGQALLIYSDR